MHKIGGTETHVDLAVTIAPTIAISEFIGQLKGASSHEVNQATGSKWNTTKRLKPNSEKPGEPGCETFNATSEPGVNAGPTTACGGEAR